MANSPAALRGFLELRRALGAGSLPEAAREGIALLVAQENGCDYGLSWHTYTGTKLAGLSGEQVRRARGGEAEDPTTAAVLSLTRSLMSRRGTVSDTELAAARGSGLTGGQITEVVAHVALNVFTTYLGKTARIAVDWPLVRHDDLNV
ncbi:carboxymuconolactone decarboxylase family protein [Streptomyces coelicoflavus]|uniref:Carboxymuconolactone decarboxylase family protein n=2 Tax=Streptomyces coelicoflavus TaxID=285562 RepID=A0A7K3PDR5_9ACTN|nr:carboxymuconolactone decarboxylase family protein [Streptomyces coelicoflavus]NEB08146.1 carboxymuconolactone decarboxylase family protein [Streptomyces coelicoflavus]